MKARYGMKEWGTWKPYVKNKKIRVDYITGEYFESGRLAPETYKKVMAETIFCSSLFASYIYAIPYLS